jgi:hypothetical protein
MPTKRFLSPSVLDEIKECLKIKSFAGMATIAAESVKDRRDRVLTIRTAAALAIICGSKSQATHLVAVRYPRLMTKDIRRQYKRMMK